MSELLSQLQQDWLLQAAMAVMLAAIVVPWIIRRFAIRVVVYTLTHSPDGEHLLAHNRLVEIGSRALPALQVEHSRLSAEYDKYCESLLTGASANPLDNYGRRSREERGYRYVIQVRHARVGAAIDAIVANASVTEKLPDSKSRQPRLTFPPGRYCATLVGLSPSEADAIEHAVRERSEGASIQVDRSPRVSGSFSDANIHAIVFTPVSLQQASDSEINAVREATVPGTCRVYVTLPEGSDVLLRATPLDDFIQRCPVAGPHEVAELVVAFFREAHALNALSTRRAFRDIGCIKAYTVLQAFWPWSCVCGVVLVLNAVALIAGIRVGIEVLGTPYVAPVANVSGWFVVVHGLYLLLRNALFQVKWVGRGDARLVVEAGVVVVLIAATITPL